MANVTALGAVKELAEGANALLKTGADLLEKLLGKPCQVAGAMLSDQIYFWQWSNRVRIVARAQQIMDGNSIAARVIPKGFLLPLLEAAGNVEDPDLQEMWARLLASSVKSDEFQHPTFIEALRQLTSDEAKIVKLMSRGRNFPVVSVDKRHTVERHGEKKQVTSWVLRHFSLLPYDAGCERPDLGPVYLENICRLGIGIIPAVGLGMSGSTMTPESYPPLENHPEIVALRAKIDGTPGEESAIDHEVIRVTALGRLFMNACIGSGE